MKKNTEFLFLLLLLPLLFTFFGLRFERARYAGDPDYIYLMNALNLSRGDNAGHIDNPGTPVMELGAVLLHIHSIFDATSNTTLENRVLKQPDTYVNFIRQVFILLIGLMMALGGWVIFIRMQNLWMALLFQITPFLSVNVLEHAWTKVSPEPLLLAITLGYALYLFWYLFGESKKNTSLIIGFSILGGLGLATKATFLPVLIIPFFLLPHWKNKVRYVLGTIAAFFLFTSPAHTEYHRMFDWFGNLITHKGIYGHGERGLVDVGLYFQNMVTIFRVNVFLSLSFLLNLIFILWILIKGKNQKTKGAWVLHALFTMQVLSVLIVAKHYANHYLMPALALNGFVFIVLLINLKEIISASVFRLLAPVFLILAALWFFLVSFAGLKYKDEGYSYTNREYDDVQKILKRDYDNYLTIYHYPDGLNAESALKFGNGYSKISNQKYLNEVYPRAYFFNMIQGYMEFWETRVSVEYLLHKYGDRWVITGRPFGHAARKVLAGFGLRFHEIYRGMFQAVYVMDTNDLSPKLKKIARGEQQIFSCDFENISNDGRYFLTSSDSISTGMLQNSNHSRSGDVSVKMDSLTEYALGLRLDELFPGQDISCSIWCYPAHAHAKIIATADDINRLYKVSVPTSRIDSNGWQQIVLNFTIPDELESLDHLKFYIRQMNREIIYLDDLEVICH